MRKLSPISLARNPLIFATAMVVAVTTMLVIANWGDEGTRVSVQITLWLWTTVLFANFA